MEIEVVRPEHELVGLLPGCRAGHLAETVGSIYAPARPVSIWRT